MNNKQEALDSIDEIINFIQIHMDDPEDEGLKDYLLMMIIKLEATINDE